MNSSWFHFILLLLLFFEDESKHGAQARWRERYRIINFQNFINTDLWFQVNPAFKAVRVDWDAPKDAKILHMDVVIKNYVISHFVAKIETVPCS